VPQESAHQRAGAFWVDKNRKKITTSGAGMSGLRFEKFTLHELTEVIILECSDADRSIIISDPVGYYQPKLVFDGLKGNPRISRLDPTIQTILTTCRLFGHKSTARASDVWLSWISSPDFRCVLAIVSSTDLIFESQVTS